MSKNDFDRCTFVVAKEDGKTASCRDHLFCYICQYCTKHCLEHNNMNKYLKDANQSKKAVIGS